MAGAAGGLWLEQLLARSRVRLLRTSGQQQISDSGAATTKTQQLPTQQILCHTTKTSSSCLFVTPGSRPKPQRPPLKSHPSNGDEGCPRLGSDLGGGAPTDADQALKWAQSPELGLKHAIKVHLAEGKCCRCCSLEGGTQNWAISHNEFHFSSDTSSEPQRDHKVRTAKASQSPQPSGSRLQQHPLRVRHTCCRRFLVRIFKRTC